MMLEMQIFQEIFGEVLFLSPVSLGSMFLLISWGGDRNDFLLQYLVRCGYHSCAFFPLWNHI